MTVVSSSSFLLMSECLQQVWLTEGKWGTLLSSSISVLIFLNSILVLLIRWCISETITDKIVLFGLTDTICVESEMNLLCPGFLLQIRHSYLKDFVTKRYISIFVGLGNSMISSVIYHIDSIMFKVI